MTTKMNKADAGDGEHNEGGGNKGQKYDEC